MFLHKDIEKAFLQSMIATGGALEAANLQAGLAGNIGTPYNPGLLADMVRPTGAASTLNTTLTWAGPFLNDEGDWYIQSNTFRFSGDSSAPNQTIGGAFIAQKGSGAKVLAVEVLATDEVLETSDSSLSIIFLLMFDHASNKGKVSIITGN
jgi:hypothetical protein